MPELPEVEVTRRRIAPMLGGDRRRLEMVFSLLLTLPGTPMIVYGDEIGMGEDLDLPGRSSVRTPKLSVTTSESTVVSEPTDSVRGMTNQSLP